MNKGFDDVSALVIVCLETEIVVRLVDHGDMEMMKKVFFVLAFIYSIQASSSSNMEQLPGAPFGFPVQEESSNATIDQLAFCKMFEIDPSNCTCSHTPAVCKVITNKNILPKSSRYFDPEVLELKKHPDPSKISIRRNFRSLVFRSGKYFIKKFLEIIQLILHSIHPEKLVFRMIEVGTNKNNLSN